MSEPREPYDGMQRADPMARLGTMDRAVLQGLMERARAMLHDADGVNRDVAMTLDEMRLVLSAGRAYARPAVIERLLEEALLELDRPSPLGYMHVRAAEGHIREARRLVREGL